MGLSGASTGTSASLTNRFTDACIASAARRWPAEISESMAYEWRAEIAVLRTERGYRRSWRAIRFAGSLALSPSVEADGALMGWRGRVPVLVRTLLAGLSLLGIAELANMLFAFTEQTTVSGSVSERAAGIADDATIVGAILIMAVIGTAAARIGLIPRADGPPYAAALAVTVPIGTAVYLLLSPTADGAPMNRLELVLTVVTWTLLSTVAAGAALRAARAGRRPLARVIAIGGALVALDIASIAGGLRAAIQSHAGYAYAPAWFPLSVLRQQTVFHITFGDMSWANAHAPSGSSANPPSLDLLWGLGSLAGPLLLCSAFVMAYVLRASRATVSAVAPVDDVEPLPARTFRITTAIGTAGVAIGLCTWALVAGTRLGIRESFDEHNLFGELLQLRLGAIALVVVAAIVLMSGRGPVVLPAAGIFVVLFTADCVIAGRTSHSFGTSVLLLIVGAACIAGAWWASGQLAGGGTGSESARRSLVGAAVAGAIAIPTFVGLRLSLLGGAAESWAHADHTVIPADFMALGYVLAVALWAVAIGAALASRRQPMSVLAAVLFIVLPLIALILFAAGVGETTLRHHMNSSPDLLIEAPLAVTALVAARWDRADAGVWELARWLLLGVAAQMMTAPLMTAESQQITLARVITGFEPRWNPVIGSQFLATEMVANQLLLALAMGVLAARLVQRRPTVQIVGLDISTQPM